MVQQICIACGNLMSMRVRFCECGHVLMENVTLSSTRRLRRHNEKRMRQVTSSLKSKRSLNANNKTIEEREFYLGQANQLQIAEKGKNQISINRPITSPRPNKRQIREEESKRKLEALFASPMFQKRLSNALSSINNKLLKQQRFFKVLDASEYMKRRKQNKSFIG